MTQEKSNSARIKVVRDLALLNRPVRECIEELSDYEWDFRGTPFIMAKSDIVDVLQRYLDGTLSSIQIEEWADAIELREDIDYEDSDREWIMDVIYTLASPELNGPITPNLVSGLLG